MKYIIVIVTVIIIGCTHKNMPLQYTLAPKVDDKALVQLSKIKESFVSENYYYISRIDSLPNDVYVIFGIKKGKIYKIVSHEGKDYERLWDDFSDNKIEVGSSYFLNLESWKETCRPKDLYEYSCYPNGILYYGNFISLNDSDLDIYYANYLNGLYLPKRR